MIEAVESLTQFVERAETIKRPDGGHVFYRGHDSSEYQLEPSVFREQKWDKSESDLLSHFQSEVPKLFSTEKNMVDRLVMAQHFGVPTRLLDFTLNPLMALFFACRSQLNKDGCVIAMRLRKYTVKFTSSDTLSCVANLAQLSWSEREKIRNLANEYLSDRASGGNRTNLETMPQYPTSQDGILLFNGEPVVKKLVQFIRGEKPYFLNSIDPQHLIYPIATLVNKNNERILAQSGVLLAFGLDERYDQQSIGHHTDFIDIPANKKSGILSALDSLGINEYSAFPEPEKIAAALRDRYR